MRILILALPFLLPQGNPLDAYRRADFNQKKGKFDAKCRDRILVEHALIRAGKPELLRPGLKDRNRNVRAFSATALGILGDRRSGPAISSLAMMDPDPLVRGQALQALAWLKDGSAAIQKAKSDRDGDVKFMARMAEGQLKDPFNYGKQVRDAYKLGLKPGQINTAKIGRPALDFAAIDHNGRPFKLSSVLRRKVIVLTFQLADW